MPIYMFEAMDRRGSEQAGQIEAGSEAQALAMIREKGLFPTRVHALGTARKIRSTKKPRASMKQDIQLPSFLVFGKKKALTQYTRQLSTLISAGLPLVSALKVLSRQERNPVLKTATNQMSEALEGGSTFAEALAQQPKVFTKLYVNMIRAGEVGGVLDRVLTSLADFMEKAQKIRSKVIGAMVYPMVVLVMAATHLNSPDDAHYSKV